MDLVLAIVQGAASLGLGLGLCLRAVRTKAALLALVAGVASLLAGLLRPETRQLEVVHTFAAYAEDGFEIVARDFVVDRTSAPGWQWPLPFLFWALAWAALLLAGRDRREPFHPFVLPLLLAWSGAAVWLLMQKLAAPAATVQPYGLERYLWPACVSLAVLLALRAERFLPVLLLLSLGTALARLPAALFSKLASDGHWGTALDVHTITAFVNPIARREVEVASGSGEQQAWLIWAQHLVFMPGLYLLSLAGIAFGIVMIRKHPAAP